MHVHHSRSSEEPQEKCFKPPAVPLCDCTSLCARERVRVRNPGRRERNGVGGGRGAHGRDSQKQNQETRSENAGFLPKRTTLDVSFLTPRVARRRRRVSRRSRRWVQRPRTAAVGWPISLCPLLQGTSTLEVLFFFSHSLTYIYFFGIDCFRAAKSAAHPPPPPQQGDYFLFFCVFFFPPNISPNEGWQG